MLDFLMKFTSLFLVLSSSLCPLAQRQNVGVAHWALLISITVNISLMFEAPAGTRNKRKESHCFMCLKMCSKSDNHIDLLKLS